MNSDKTVQRYIYGLDKFCEYVSLTYEEILSLDIEDLTTKMEDWVMSMAGLRKSSIRTPLAGLEKFLDVNRKLYHKKSIHSLIKTDKDMGGGGEPFTTLDIQKMLQVTTSLRMKAVIHFMNSLGIRPAGLTDPVLRKKHLIEMPNNCYAIRIYDNTKEGYWGFLTPEARKALDHYLNSRKLNGERITEESPLFATNSPRAKTSHMKNDTLYELLATLYRKAGIERQKVGHRYDKSLTYGFRKRYNTILKINNSVNSNIAEKLMGHKKGLDGAYLTPTRDECFSEFVKAVPDLTINDSERQKLEIAKKDQKITELTVATQKIEQLQSELDHTTKLAEGLAEVAKFNAENPRSQCTPEVISLLEESDRVRTSEDLKNLMSKVHRIIDQRMIE